MSDLERVDTWRLQAERAIDNANDPAIDAAAQEREDQATSQVAVADVYEAWFRNELLPVHEETWHLAIRSLVQYGHPLRCTGSTYTKYGLSTGMLAVEGPRHVGERGMDAIATGLRLSMLSNEVATFGVRRAIAKSQEDPHNQKRLRRAADAVDDVARNSLIMVEAATVSTNKERLNPMTRDPLTEVEYPRTWRQRMHNFYDNKSNELVREAMQTPDIRVHRAPLSVFRHPKSGQYEADTYKSDEMHLYPPSVFMPSDLKHRSGQEGLEQAQQAAQREVARIATLGSMLIAVERPLREVAAFQPRI